MSLVKTFRKSLAGLRLLENIYAVLVMGELHYALHRQRLTPEYLGVGDTVVSIPIASRPTSQSHDFVVGIDSWQEPWMVPNLSRSGTFQL